MNQYNHRTIAGDALASLPVVFYFISAGLLAIVASALLYEGINITISSIRTETLASSSGGIFQSFFHAATAIALLETIEIFFRTHRIAFRILLLAGLAEIVRYVLIYDLPRLPEGDIISPVILISASIGGILISRYYPGREDARRKKFTSKRQKKQVGIIRRVFNS